MSLLLETTLGDLVIDLDLEGSPELCKNVLKLAKARYYTSTLVYNVQPNRFCQLGDPHGDGSGGACIHALLSTLQEHGTLDDPLVVNSHNRFLKSNMGRPLRPEECQLKGRVVATEMQGIPDTIGSQLLITTCQGNDMALDGYQPSNVSSSLAAAASATGTNHEETPVFRSVGVVVEDDNDVLGKIGTTYCDATGRPYADIRVIRALVIDDPFEDPEGMDKLLKARGVVVVPNNPSASSTPTRTHDDDDWQDLVTASPTYDRPPEETVEIRISADQIDALPGEEDPELLRQQEEELLKREDKSRAVVLEMLGDLPDADITAPENVLFVCKLNPVTEDEDLELIFSRFDENVKAEIIRDHETGSSLQYAFVEFSKKEQAVEAYFKMNNALVDDRRIKVDFSQSVAKVWNKFTQRTKGDKGNHSNQHMPRDPFSDSTSRPRGGRNNASHRPRGNDAAAHGMQRNRPGNYSRNDSAPRGGPRSNQYRNDSDRYNNDRNTSTGRSERHYAADNSRHRRDNDDRGINDNNSKYDDHRDRSRRRDHRDRESRRDERGRRYDDNDDGSTNPDDRREKRRREHRSQSRRERKHHRRHRDDSGSSEDDDSVRRDKSPERRKHKRRHRDREDDDDGRERRRRRSESEDEGERKSHHSSREDRKKSHRKHSHRDKDRRHHDHKEKRSRDHDDYR